MTQKMAATEHLTSLIEQEMNLIEKDSSSLEDHVQYWGNVRRQHMLKYAARNQGLKRLGMHLLPPCCVSAVKAKQAIEMHLLCASLCSTRWANDPWTLTDSSWERFCTPPKNCFKKEPRVVEVIYDEDSSNRVWYTLWDCCLFLTDKGWYQTRCAADSNGCYYIDMMGARVYYHSFADDARQFSTTGKWDLLNETSVISSSTHPAEVEFDGIPPDFVLRGQHPGEPQGTSTGDHGAPRTQPNSPVSSSTSSHDNGDSRSGIRECSLPSPGGARNCRFGSTGSSNSGSLSPGLAPVSQRSEEEVRPDSSREAPPSSPENEEEQLLGGPQQVCLLVRGSVNRVKCFRHRCRHHHRRKYRHVTTTLQIVGEGNGRLGEAMMLFTYTNWEQREQFLRSVTVPPGVKITKLTMHAD